MYDEKYAQQLHNYYNAKDPQGWLLGLQDYLSSRCQEVDDFLKWISEQEEELNAQDLAKHNGFMDHDRGNVSRQLWGLLSSLLQNDPEQMLIFRNVTRHNGAEAWRRMTEPILEGRDLRRKQYQPRVLRPRAAGKVDDIPVALEQWESDYRLFKESGGSEIEDEQRRLILIEMLPPDISVYVTLHMSAYPTFSGLRKFIRDYVKVVSHQLAMKSQKPLFNVDHSSSGTNNGSATRGCSEYDGYDDDNECAGFETYSEEDQQDILAFMRQKGIQRPQNGRNGGRPPFQRRNIPQPRGGGGRPGAPRDGARPTNPPPRDRTDLSCVNCGRKGHIAAECRQEKNDFKSRPCFKCQKPGHIATYC